jgi:hypothetical protein
MATPLNLFEALNSYQAEAASICAAANKPASLVPNCCFDTQANGNIYISIEARNAAGELVFSANGADPLADLARQLGVDYPVKYATNGQKESLKRLLDAVGADAAERARLLLPLNRYTYTELETINADLNRRVGIAAAAEAQREALSQQQRLAA